MKVLITGGAGFLGSALANALIAGGHTVRAVDDLSSGDPERLNPAVHFQRGDVADIPRMWTMLQGVDVVCHLAARVSVSESVLYPGEYNATNVGGTIATCRRRQSLCPCATAGFCSGILAAGRHFGT